MHGPVLKQEQKQAEPDGKLTGWICSAPCTTLRAVGQSRRVRYPRVWLRDWPWLQMACANACAIVCTLLKFPNPPPPQRGDGVGSGGRGVVLSNMAEQRSQSFNRQQATNSAPSEFWKGFIQTHCAQPVWLPCGATGEEAEGWFSFCGSQKYSSCQCAVVHTTTSVYKYSTTKTSTKSTHSNRYRNADPNIIYAKSIGNMNETW